MKSSMSLKGKVLGLCTLLAAFSAIMGLIIHYVMNAEIEKYTSVVRINLPKVQYIGRMNDAMNSIRGGLRGLALPDAPPEAIAAQMKFINEGYEEYNKAFDGYKALPKGPKEDDVSAPVFDAWKDYHGISEKLVALYTSTNPEAVKTFHSMLLVDERPIFNKLNAALDKLIDYQDERADVEVAEAEAQARTGDWISLALAVTSFVLAMIAGFIFANSLAKKLREIAAKIGTGSNDVAGASAQISDAGAQLSSSATEQAAAVQQTVSSIDQVSAMVSKNSENAANSRKIAEKSSNIVADGKRVVADMLQSMSDISSSNADIMTQSESSNQEIANIVKVIAEIGNKTKVINDIVFQTKLLSFNASVEAARAGEHGKGFAVVAEEVGNLAQMSGNAAKEISLLLEESIRKVESTVGDTRTKIDRLMNRSKEKVESGLATARRCGDVFDEVVSSVSEVSAMVSEIASASREQAQGVQEITKAMGQMDQVTQQNAAAANESASAAEQLTSQAVVLREMVDTLIVTIEGGIVPEAGASTHRASSAPKAHKASGQLIDFKRKPANNPSATISRSSSTMSFKKAAGAEELPSENDPRFEDV